MKAEVLFRRCILSNGELSQAAYRTCFSVCSFMVFRRFHDLRRPQLMAETIINITLSA